MQVVVSSWQPQILFAYGSITIKDFLKLSEPDVSVIARSAHSENSLEELIPIFVFLRKHLFQIPLAVECQIAMYYFQ